MRPKYLVAILALLALTLPAFPAHAGGVVSVCDETNLKTALTGGGTVTFSCSGTITLTSTITIADDTTLDGSGQNVTISGGGAVGVFLVGSGVTFNLNKLTVANGSGFYGGGIGNYGTLNVTNCTFSGNSASNGGGIFIGSGTATVSNSTFSGNSVSQGGGIYNDGFRLTVSNSTFSGNTATSNGGGIASTGRDTVSNSTFSGNSAGSEGGGIFSEWGTLDVTNSTFSGNSATSGGGIHADHGTATLKNTLVANSPAGGNCSGTITDGGGNLSYGDTTCPGINGDPKLGPLQDNGGPTKTMALGTGSAALDAANDAICAAPPVNNLDQRGVARPQGPHCDIGAYEETSTTPPVVSVCDEAHLRAALAGGGTVTFTCSGTITLASTITINTNTTLDGSGQNVTISGGGAVRVFEVGSGVTFNLNKLTIANGNVADSYGGGIFNGSGALAVSNCTFSGNSAGSEGGGIANGGTLTVSNCTFSGNHAYHGGGIANLGPGHATVSNSTFFGNSATGDGGGIYNTDIGIYNGGMLTVINSTFSGNSAGEGGGIYNDYLMYGVATLKNTIIANSPAGGNCSGTFTDGGGNLSYGDATCPGINGDPKLGTLQNNGGPTQTMALGIGSAARDAAVDAICAAPPVNNLDQRGVARPQGPHCDIGAYESEVYLKVYLPLIKR